MDTLLGVSDTPAEHVDLGRRRSQWPLIATRVTKEREVATQLLELARQKRWQLVTLEKYNNDLPPSVSPRGAILTPSPQHRLLQTLVNLEIPTVQIGSLGPPTDPAVPVIVRDLYAAGRLAAEHFAEREFRHVAYIGREPWGGHRELYDGFADRAGELGCECHLRRVTSPEPGQQTGLPDRRRWEARQREFADWLKSMPKPIGLLGFGDFVADRYCHWAAEAGLRVPVDVAVLGVGNDPFVCECSPVPISSIAFDHGHIARTAVAMLDKLMAGEALEQKVVKVAPERIQTRQSTDVLAVADPCVVKALRFMWDHIDQNMPVGEIASHVGVSRRTLERGFEKELGRGVNREFQRRRLEKARSLLLQTDMRVANISDMLGFSSQNYFSQVFRSTYGKSPAYYRREHKQPT